MWTVRCLRNSVARTTDSDFVGDWLVKRFADRYNFHRLHRAIGYITPADMLGGRAEAIRATRDKKLKAALAQRRTAWARARDKTT